MLVTTLGAVPGVSCPFSRVASTNVLNIQKGNVECHLQNKGKGFAKDNLIKRKHFSQAVRVKNAAVNYRERRVFSYLLLLALNLKVLSPSRKLKGLRSRADFEIEFIQIRQNLQ